MLYNLVDNMSADFKIALSTVHELCETIDTPYSLAASLCLQYQEWGEYLALKLDPANYEDPGNFAADYLVSQVLRKHPDMPLGIDRYAVALQSFKDSEEQCRLTNLRLDTSKDPRIHSVAREVDRILGPLRRADLDYVEDQFRHGGGATTGVRGQGSTASSKYDTRLHLTVGLIPFYRSILGEQWWEYHRSPAEVVEGNKFTTVPKTALTDRGICIEPTLNMYCQLGIGALLRNRLRKVGINLNSQDRNRYLASVAEFSKLATIDLSAASDSVATSLILHLFSEPWVELLSICRSDHCLIDGAWHELYKWSSMGNGYTFELESLIFLAVCNSVVPKGERDRVSVFGDDIIVPQQYAVEVIDTLNLLGFKVNVSKSFLAGSFFESCGHDYFKGVNVRPFHLKQEDSIPFALQAANKLRLYCWRLNDGISCDMTYRHVWQNLVRKIPRTWSRCKVPASFGDSGLITSKEEAGPPLLRDGHEGHLVRHISLTPLVVRKHTFGVLLAALARSSGPALSFSVKNLRRTSGLFHLTAQEIEQLSDITPSLFTKGREPRRGLFGKPKVRLSSVKRWTKGLEWGIALLR